MDHLMVDLGRNAGVRLWDEAVLIGAGPGGRITVAEIAAASGTIPYEILCRLNPRLPRIYTTQRAA